MFLVFSHIICFFAIRIVNKGTTELSYIGNGDGEWLSLLLNGIKFEIYIIDDITEKFILKCVQGMYNFISSEKILIRKNITEVNK